MINLIDKYKGEFLRGGLVYSKDTLDPITFAQDPTYLSFHVEFFFGEYVSSPDAKNSTADYYTTDDFLVNTYGHNGLLIPPKYNIDSNKGGSSNDTGNTSNTPVITKKADRGPYEFVDSAEDYLYSIGAVNKLASLRSFKKLLYSLQTKTPWYFQKISGAEQLYLIDKAVNSHKDGILTFDLLESIDQRSSLLADLYRQAAWDFERHREVLPINTRTFKMKIHVFEMRNFNTYSGTIAGFLKNTTESAYQDQINAYWQMSTSQQKDIQNKTPEQSLSGNSIGRGIGGNSNTGVPNASKDLTSAFNAITLRTYELDNCEFDFFTTAPNYLSELSVVEIPQASFQFKIKFGSVRATSDYPFFRFMLDSISANSTFPIESGVFPNSLSPGDISTLKAFYEPGGTERLTNYQEGKPAPGSENLDENYITAKLSALQQRQNMIEQQSPEPIPNGSQGVVFGGLESRLTGQINRLVRGIGNGRIGNIYGNNVSSNRVANILTGFLDPKLFGLNLQDTQIGNVNFDNLTVEQNVTPRVVENLASVKVVEQGTTDILPVDKNITQDKFDILPIDNKIEKITFTKPPVQPIISPKNVYTGK